MIELLILSQLNTKKVLTMYGIYKEIHLKFSVLTTPSFGTIKPALKRLEKNFFIKSQKNMSSGGRPSVYYTITPEGKEELIRLILEEPAENPIHFLPLARIKLVCSEILSSDEQIKLCNILKDKSEIIYYELKNLISQNNITFNSKIVFNNLISEYKNFTDLLEGLKKCRQ